MPQVIVDRKAHHPRPARQYPDLIAQLAGHGEPGVSYRRVGALWLPPADSTDQDAALTATARRLTTRRANAPEIGDVEILTHASTLFPPLRPDTPAVHIAGAARVDGRRLAAALTRASVRLGTQVRTGHAVLKYRTGRVHAVALNSEHLPADAVVAATGAQAAAFDVAPFGPQR